MVNETSPNPEVTARGGINPKREQEVEGWQLVRDARELAGLVDDFADRSRDLAGWAFTSVECQALAHRLRFSAENEQFRLERAAHSA